MWLALDVRIDWVVEAHALVAMVAHNFVEASLLFVAGDTGKQIPDRLPETLSKPWKPNEQEVNGQQRRRCAEN